MWSDTLEHKHKHKSFCVTVCLAMALSLTCMFLHAFTPLPKGQEYDGWRLHPNLPSQISLLHHDLWPMAPSLPLVSGDTTLLTLMREPTERLIRPTAPSSSKTLSGSFHCLTAVRGWEEGDGTPAQPAFSLRVEPFTLGWHEHYS